VGADPGAAAGLLLRSAPCACASQEPRLTPGSGCNHGTAAPVGTDPLLPAANACARPCQQLAELLGEGEGGIWQLPTCPVPLPALKRTLPPPLPMLQVGTGTEQELPVLVALGTIPPPCSQGIKSSGEVWRGQQSPPVFIGSPAVTAHLQCPTERSGCSV